MICLVGEHVHYKGQSVISSAHLGVKNPFHVFQPLIYSIRAGFAIKLHWMLFQKVLQTPLPGWRSWLKLKTGVVVMFSSNWRRASMCCMWASLVVTLAAFICCIPNYCCSNDVAWRCIDASCCCIIVVLCCVIAATIASISLTMSGTSP